MNNKLRKLCLIMIPQNPDVAVNNVSTGVLNSENNRRVIDSLTPVMSTFRERPDLIFVGNSYNLISKKVNQA